METSVKTPAIGDRVENGSLICEIVGFRHSMYGIEYVTRDSSFECHIFATTELHWSPARAGRSVKDAWVVA